MAVVRMGRKVELRPLTQADAPRLVELLGDPEVNRNLRVRAPVSLAVEREFIAALSRTTDQLVLGIAARDDGRLLGVAGLHQLADPARQAELGLFLGGPSEWGKGFGTEATWLLCQHGFEALGLNRIWLHVYADNLRGLRAYERVGFRREGVLRQGAVRDGRHVDVVSMGILRSEWTGVPE
ncbi:MAG TPA: GNAT family protein [Anaeromyxobacter sp.]|nr:GNAT family protein [Anaeromyxobacter sp.]